MFSFSVKINSNDIKNVLSRVDGIAARCRSQKPFFVESAGLVADGIKHMFLSHGEGTWPAVKPRKDKSPHPLGGTTGKVFRKATDLSVWMTDHTAVYMAPELGPLSVLHTGFDGMVTRMVASRNARSGRTKQTFRMRIPARPFFMVPSSHVKIWETNLVWWILYGGGRT